MSGEDHRAAHTYQGIPFGPPWPVPETVVSRLVQHARTRGGDPFLTAVAADNARTHLSYGDLDRHSRAFAGWLVRECGVAPGSRVGLAPTNDAASVVAVLGLLRLGCPALLLSPADPADRLREQSAALDTAVVLRSPLMLADHLPEAVPIPAIAQLPAGPPPVAEPPLDPAADALFFGTSGSTASAKLVAQSHYNTVANAEAVRRHHSLRRGDRILGCLPIHHVNGLHFTVLGTLFAGAHLVLAHAFDPFGYPRLLDEFEPRLASVVPSVLETLLEIWRDGAPPAGLEYFVSAAAPLTPATVRTLMTRKRIRVIQGYGLTETTNFATTVPPEVSAETYRRLLADADIPSIGCAVYGNEVVVLRADGTPATDGEIGEICMRGHNVMDRYAGNADATREAMRMGWFHSQDLGYRTTDRDSGRGFFVVTGRLKNIAKVGGETVSLEEMERLLRALPGIRDAACVAVARRFVGEEIVAAVVPTGPHRPDVRAHLRSAFAAAVLPRHVVTVDAIPRTATGKILRPQLVAQLAGLVAEPDPR